MKPSRSEEERRKVFRQLEWVLVYLPPVAAVLLAVSASFAIAYVVPVPRTTFWGRWALAMLILTVVPVIVHLVRSRFMK